MNEFPKDAVASLPWGMEIKWGDGVWVVPEGAKLRRLAPEEWRDSLNIGVACGIKVTYALPVTLARHELVQVGEVPPGDAMHRFKNSNDAWEVLPFPGEPCCLPVCADDVFWFMRPVAATPAKPGVEIKV